MDGINGTISYAKFNKNDDIEDIIGVDSYYYDGTSVSKIDIYTFDLSNVFDKLNNSIKFINVIYFSELEYNEYLRIMEEDKFKGYNYIDNEQRTKIKILLNKDLFGEFKHTSAMYNDIHVSHGIEGEFETDVSKFTRNSSSQVIKDIQSFLYKDIEHLIPSFDYPIFVERAYISISLDVTSADLKA